MRYAGQCVRAALDRDDGLDATIGWMLIGQAVVGAASWASPKK